MSSLKNLALALALAAATTAYGQACLTPLDFGLKPLPRGRIDYTHTPPNVLVGQFNSDCYPDIARFEGEKLEIYLLEASGYPGRPQLQRHFAKAIKSIRLDGIPWDTRQTLLVTLQDGSEETFNQGKGILDLRENDGFLPAPSTKSSPPREVCDFDFQLVWESDPKPYGMDRVTAGDLDNDGINELVTWWKDSLYADTAYILIYKSTGDNQYELFMEEPFFTIESAHPGLTALMITDLDSNGQKELMFTLGYCHFWEFSAPGVYTVWRSNFQFARAVQDITTSDIDEDGRPEISAVTGNDWMTPPCYYYVEEFQAKDTGDSTFQFAPIGVISQEWLDCRLAVGDFDNDGTCDIVSGWPGYLTSWEATWIYYFRYTPGAPNNFIQYWLLPGVWATCSMPIVADLDEDSENELYAAGFGGYSSSSNGSGSAFLWEATGLGTGYVSWWDTTTMIYAPYGSVFGEVDGEPCILNVVPYWIDGIFYMFGFNNSQFSIPWQSDYYDSITFAVPVFTDIDQDGKMDFGAMANIGTNEVPNPIWIWEQTSAGITPNPDEPSPASFTIYQNFPNPFNGLTIIPLDIAVSSAVEIQIFDIAGRSCFTYRDERLPPGRYGFRWEAADQPAGIYLIRAKAGTATQALKAVLIK